MDHKSNSLQNPLFLFDGDCGFCQWGAEKLEKIDEQKKVRLVNYQSFSEEELASYRLNTKLCSEAVRWIGKNKRIYSGAHAINRFLWEYWPWKAWVFLSYVSIVIILLEILAYPLIAKNRQKISQLLGLKACQIPNQINKSEREI